MSHLRAGQKNELKTIFFSILLEYLLYNYFIYLILYFAYHIMSLDKA
jgi:hypothetical protein